MKNIIITGSTGMIGNLILHKCLERYDVKMVTTVVRKKTGLVHPKLLEVIHKDFTDFTLISEALKDQDVCFYCIGVYTGQVPKKEFAKITIDFTKAFAEALKINSPDCSFCFLSGQGADAEEKSSVMFARDKGIAENIILALQFPYAYLFRPSYIYPVTKRKEPNLLYKIMRLLYKPILLRFLPGRVIDSEQLSSTMVEIGLNGGSKTIYENTDIRSFATKLLEKTSNNS